MKFGHLIHMKIFKFVATRCQILRLKCTKFNFGWASAPDPAGRAYSAPHTIDGFKGPTSNGGRRVENGRVGGREHGRGGNEREGRGRTGPPRVGSHPISEILKNTLIAELI